MGRITKQIKGKIIFKHETEADWKLSSYVPDEGEQIIYDPDDSHSNPRIKYGDGITLAQNLPFSGSQADWNQNVDTAADYVKNRTHYNKLSYQEVNVGYDYEYIGTAGEYQGKVIHTLYNQNQDECYCSYDPIGTKFLLEITQNNNIIFSDIIIKHEDWTEIYDSSNESVIGNTGIHHPEIQWNTEELSYIYVNDAETHINFCLDSSINNFSTAEPFIVTLSKITEETKQLDEKYIPDTIARVADRTHYEDIIDVNEILIENKLFTALPDIEEEGIYGRFEYVGPEEADYTKDITEHCNTITINVNDSVFEGKLTYDSSTERYAAVVDAVSGSLCYDYNLSAEVYIKGNTVYFVCGYFAGDGFYADKIAISGTKTNIKQLDEKFIPDTIARVDQYDKYGKDSFSANATAKAISAKSAAFGFNTQAGSFAYTVTALDPVAKTFTLDSVEGLEVDDIYTVDLSFYKADGTATEELYTNYGKITAISADNVVTVDTFPSDVARYRVPDEPYIDENGLDGEENVFRVIAKPNVGNRAIGTKSFAIGNSSQALSKNSVAMGKACIAYGAHSVAIGYDNKTTYAATSFGRSNTASGVKSVAIGYNNTSSGEGSIAFGNSNTSSNKGSFASGTSNKATGANSFAAGHSNKVQGKYSIALGYNNTSSGEGSIAFGNSNISSSKGSFVSGTSNTATGTNSFALGSTNRATGTSSFAHGYNNDATQTGSAVFGTNSKSQGESSFAAGASVEASGHYSQAFGYKTKATGRAAFAEGEGTIAARHQHVEGRYNIEDDAIKYAHIIGNGKDDQNRKNIYTVDWNGNAWFAGEVRVGEGNEKLVTETELNEKITIAIGNAIGGAY